MITPRYGKMAMMEIARDVQAAVCLIENFRVPVVDTLPARWRRSSPLCDGDSYPVAINFECAFDESSPRDSSKPRAVLRLWCASGRFSQEARAKAIAEQTSDASLQLLWVLHMHGNVSDEVTNLNVMRGQRVRVEVYSRCQLQLWEPEYPLRHILAEDVREVIDDFFDIHTDPASLQELLPLAPEVVFTGACEGDLIVCFLQTGPSFFVVVPGANVEPRQDRVLHRLRQAHGLRTVQMSQLRTLSKVTEEYALSLPDRRLKRLLAWRGQPCSFLETSFPELIEKLTTSLGCALEQWPSAAADAIVMGLHSCESRCLTHDSDASSASSDADEADEARAEGLAAYAPTRTCDCIGDEDPSDMSDVHLLEYRARLNEQLYRHYSMPDHALVEEIRAAAPSWLALAGEYDCSQSLTSSDRREFWNKLSRLGLPRMAGSCAAAIDGGGTSFTMRAQVMIDWFALEH